MTTPILTVVSEPVDSIPFPTPPHSWVRIFPDPNISVCSPDPNYTENFINKYAFSSNSPETIQKSEITTPSMTFPNPGILFWGTASIPVAGPTQLIRSYICHINRTGSPVIIANSLYNSGPEQRWNSVAGKVWEFSSDPGSPFADAVSLSYNYLSQTLFTPLSFNHFSWDFYPSPVIADGQLYQAFIDWTITPQTGISTLNYIMQTAVLPTSGTKSSLIQLRKTPAVDANFHKVNGTWVADVNRQGHYAYSTVRQDIYCTYDPSYAFSSNQAVFAYISDNRQGLGGADLRKRNGLSPSENGSFPGSISDGQNTDQSDVDIYFGAAQEVLLSITNNSAIPKVVTVYIFPAVNDGSEPYCGAVYCNYAYPFDSPVVPMGQACGIPVLKYPASDQPLLAVLDQATLPPSGNMLRFYTFLHGAGANLPMGVLIYFSDVVAS